MADMREFAINWKFFVRAETEEQAKLQVEDTMKAFAQFQGWPVPQPMERAS